MDRIYSIIIVDDETDVRRAIIEIIQWDRLGFTLAGQAGNGQEALALIDEVRPDVIITDIKMPFMDGITLAKQVREVNPVTKIVFLTGFNDFDYAISAIKLNVIEYLLKPISAKNLTETLTSIREKLDKEQRAIQDMELLREGYHQSLSMRKMSFLISLVTEEASALLDEETARQAAREYGLNLLGEKLLLFSVSVDTSSLGEAIVPIDDLELLKFSVLNTTRAIARKYMKGEVFIFGSMIIGLLSDDGEVMDAYSDILVREVHQTIPRFYGFTATIGVSDPYTSVTRTREAYRASLSASHYRGILGRGKVIYLSDVEGGSEFVPVFSDTRDMQLCSIIKTGSKGELTAFVDEIFAELAVHKAGRESYRISLVEMYAVVLRALKSVSNTLEEGIRGDLSFREELFSHDPPSQREWLVSLCHKVMDSIQRQQKTTAVVIAERGYDYLRGRYMDPNISLKTVSGHLHISPSYFSALFKREAGLSFTEALIKIRMDAARELLLTGQDRIFEIAEKTGYADQHYFSYCFKKYFGQSPNEMRAARAAKTL